MRKKRIIFTLLYNDGQFMLSRNFRLQKVGDANWLKRNYNFSDLAFFIDELVILDVSRGPRNKDAFCKALSQLTEGCFAPISAGGGVTSVQYARSLLRAGADKVVVNSILIDDASSVREISAEFGQQCLVGSLDVKRNGTGGYDLYIHNGSHKLGISASDALGRHVDGVVGEIYLNSIDRDGTGQGYDFGTLDLLPKPWGLPIIMAGGVGNVKHLAEGLQHPGIDAVATAHLFNFVGNGLKTSRQSLIDGGVQLAVWPDIDEFDLVRRAGGIQ